MAILDQLWPAERTARLVCGVADKKPAAELAAELGISRNAVHGKINRLGLSKPMPLYAWTKERDAILTERVASNVGATKIGAEIGASPDAVYRRARRLGLRACRTTSEVGSDGALTQRLRKIKAKKPQGALSAVNAKISSAHSPHGAMPVELIDIIIPIGQRRTILELTEATCRWPIGDPGSKEFFYCGGAADNTAMRPYCNHHHRVAYQPVRR